MDLYLALGSNSGNREENIRSAIELIQKKIGNVINISNNYENEAKGFLSDTLFLNNCIQVQSNASPIDILTKIKAIESTMGREPKKSLKYTSRPIDIDIVLYGNITLSSPELTIPHTLFRERDFVLIPLFEIAPQTIDPITNLSILQLLDLCNF